MLKKSLLFVLMIMVICSGVLLAQTGAKMPPPEADALWAYITQTNPYQNWHYLPGHEGLYKGKSPHGRDPSKLVRFGYQESVRPLSRYESNTLLLVR